MPNWKAWMEDYSLMLKYLLFLINAFMCFGIYWIDLLIQICIMNFFFIISFFSYYVSILFLFNTSSLYSIICISSLILKQESISLHICKLGAAIPFTSINLTFITLHCHVFKYFTAWKCRNGTGIFTPIIA